MTLRARIALSSFVVALLASAALTALFAVDAHNARLARLRAEGRRVAFSAVTLYDVLRLTGSAADRATLQAFLDAAVRGTSSEEELGAIDVVDAAGASVARSAGKNAPAKDDALTIEADVIARDSEKKVPDAPAGKVVVVLSTAPARAALVRSVAVAGAVSLAVALAFAALLFSFVSRRVVAPIKRVVAGMEGVEAGALQEIAPQVGSDEAAALVDGFNDMVGALKKKQSTLERHVGKRVISDLERAMRSGAQGAHDDKGRRLPVTALYFDIESFGARVSRDDPEYVVSFLHEVIDAVVGVIDAHQGHVVRLVGDAVIAVWGVPSASNDDARRAVDAALAIQARCKEISEAMRARREEAFTIGVGVASGDAVLTTLGSAERAESVIVGEPMALSQRAQEEAKATHFGLLVSEGTYQRVADAFEGAGTPPMLLRGFGVPVTLYRVRPRAKSVASVPPRA